MRPLTEARLANTRKGRVGRLAERLGGKPRRGGTSRQIQAGAAQRVGLPDVRWRCDPVTATSGYGDKRQGSHPRPPLLADVADGLQLLWTARLAVQSEVSQKPSDFPSERSQSLQYTVRFRDCQHGSLVSLPISKNSPLLLRGSVRRRHLSWTIMAAPLRHRNCLAASTRGAWVMSCGIRRVASCGSVCDAYFH